MDQETIRTYDSKAAHFAADWEDEQAPPTDLQDAVRQYFRHGPTADIGCGSGRDTAWLADNGFDVIGVDASVGLIQEAQTRHPSVRFRVDALPELRTLQRSFYSNVLCETVIMHLEQDLIPGAVRQLVSLLVPDGALYLTWRVTRGNDVRDHEGRLYSSFDPTLVTDALVLADIVVNEECVSTSSGKVIHRIIAFKKG